MSIQGFRDVGRILDHQHDHRLLESVTVLPLCIVSESASAMRGKAFMLRRILGSDRLSVEKHSHSHLSNVLQNSVLHHTQDRAGLRLEYCRYCAQLSYNFIRRPASFSKIIAHNQQQVLCPSHHHHHAFRVSDHFNFYIVLQLGVSSDRFGFARL